MTIVLFDNEVSRAKILPITLTRAMAHIRMGIFTAAERWQKLTGCAVQLLTESYLQAWDESIINDEYILIDATVIPSAELVASIISLKENEAIADSKGLVAGRIKLHDLPKYGNDFIKLFNDIKKALDAKRLEFPHQIFQWNEEVMQFDFDLVTKNRTSAIANDSVQIINPSKVFIEESADINYSILNASAGPIYIGKNATVMEGCLIRGSFALCDNSTLKMGTKIYGSTTLGPHCVGGGEIKNTVMIGYSNKAHDGYLGDSVIGEWCNLGAGTSNSNVKNTGSDVTTWNHFEKKFISAGLKCGLIMGDYSRTAINTAINTGTVAAACCNIFGDGLTPKLIPDFTWGTKEPCRYEFEKALKDIANWKAMKGKELSEKDKEILKYIFENNKD